MTIRVALHHETEYRYDRLISLGPQLVRLRPAFHTRTPIDAYSLRVEPEEHFRNWQRDPFGNPIARFVFPKPCQRFKVVVDLIADMTVINPFDFFIEEQADCWPFQYEESLRRQLGPYLLTTELTPRLARWIESLPKSADRLVDYLVEVNQRLKDRIDYLVRLEPGVQSPEETLTLGSGSCRDSAWLMVETFRQIGLAARFVSGYLIQLTADQASLDGPSGPKADFCDLHAWTEVYLPGAGWVGLDPTSGLLASEGHIPLACTPSFTGAAPVSGGHEPCEVGFDHRMSVERFSESPRVTKPYTNEQWDTIMETGREIDRRLNSQDVRLTMGGEPTFVSIDNMDDPQWNTEAVGAEKRVLSNLLLLKLRDRFAPGGLLHYGQGKWYPGESLPRWALSCIWRRDGEPIWTDPQWIADEGHDYGFATEDAERFVQHLAVELGISAKQTFPVYEDTFHYLWRENRLPIDVDPTDPHLDDPNERAMMVRTFTSGLRTPVGFVMPIRRAWWQAQPGWMGGRWPTRNEKVFLLPGDSPIGLRLPLEILPESSVTENAIYSQPFDPTVPRGPLPKGLARDWLRDEPSHGDVSDRDQFVGSGINKQQLEQEDDNNLPTNEDIVRTALCVEVRHGRIHVFLPPTQRLEDYLELISAIENTCAVLKLPVLIEGYLPPPDHRVEIFKVTPDPGVIEVNTQPTESWQQLVDLTETIYEEARLCRLGNDKFDLDGRHTGTGGGNHIVLGGRSPSDSPFLRRPDLLGSFIRFWNNHPSLSYLFSSRFIGPTSQAPRFDEGRPNAVYEMEIALRQLPSRDLESPPWLVDRLFRDLLVDLTGNTHRAEICIDKLYSPDSTAGRLGLVELRGFEMPPHPRMSLAQQLLIRGIVAAFWDRPYEQPLCHWQTALHDRFMLPHFAWRDLSGVIAELGRAGIDLDASWYMPHYEFRFPNIGEAHYGDITMRLRAAIEPWYVLGEEPGGGGTARYVDSSIERLELLVDSFELTRYRVLCNGINVPLHATGTQGQYVAGIRYRAWQPPRCLHPTIKIHSPLRFEVIDAVSGLSTGGCTYHVVHPGGRGTDRFPVNSNEAEARRANRFETIGLTGGRMEVPKLPVPSGPEPYPLTLDLRRF
ncbi:MAG TPA: IMP dehydrogenase [Rhodopirellula sp.]|nr:MAG: IMP dehydrogenase [Saprospirales bacterium TMED214]HBV63508.1 IMP dehydrogenase [Rhodopirellula sp.]